MVRLQAAGRCSLRAAAGLVAECCALLPRAAGCCYYRQSVIPSAARNRDGPG